MIKNGLTDKSTAKELCKLYESHGYVTKMTPEFQGRRWRVEAFKPYYEQFAGFLNQLTKPTRQ